MQPHLKNSWIFTSYSSKHRNIAEKFTDKMDSMALIFGDPSKSSFNSFKPIIIKNSLTL